MYMLFFFHFVKQMQANQFFFLPLKKALEKNTLYDLYNFVLFICFD